METKRKILVRYRRGETIRAISRDLNISRNTVRSIIYSKEPVQDEYVRTIQPLPKLGEYIETLEKLLRANKHVKPPKKRYAHYLKNYGAPVVIKVATLPPARYIHLWQRSEQLQ